MAPVRVAAVQSEISADAGANGAIIRSACPVDSIFTTKVRTHAAITCCWMGLAAPAQTRTLVRAAVFGPDGSHVGEAAPDGDLVVADVDPSDPAFRPALELARPWRRHVRDTRTSPASL